MPRAYDSLGHDAKFAVDQAFNNATYQVGRCGYDVSINEDADDALRDSITEYLLTCNPDLRN